MPRFPIKLVVSSIAAILLLIFLNAYFIKGGVGNFFLAIIEKPSDIIFSKVGSIRLFLKEASNFKNLVQENLDLKSKNLELLAGLAQTQDLKDENEFLRNALSLSKSLDLNFIEGNIFSENFSPTGGSMLLNKGIQDGISNENIVISETGVLIGQVSGVFKNYSTVSLVTNSDFKITAKVLNSKVSGLAKGALTDGIYMDFVDREDDIKEGDIVITNGNDLIPSALILGTIDHIENNPTSLFKKVRVKPAIYDINLGRVLIINK